jgi:serpin B
MSPKTFAPLFALSVACGAPRVPDTVAPPALDAGASLPAPSPIASAPAAEVDAAPPLAEPAKPPAAVDPSAPAYTAPLGPADHDFALRLYATQRSTAGNLFLSPASLRVALAMVYAGARGETASQMARALGFAPDVAATGDYFAGLLKDWNAGVDPKVKLRVVNRLWGQKDLRFVPDFTGVLGKRYAAPLERLDFAHAADASRRKINAWVDARTEHLIKDLLQPGDVDGSTRVVLTNAIYFKGAWASPFAKTATTTGAFHVAAGKDVAAPLMHKEGRFAYAETPEAKFLALPYGTAGMSMLVVLPQATFGLDDVERSLGASLFDEAVSSMRTTQVEVTLPKVTTTRRASLKSALGAMGMPLVFTESADLTGMAEGKLHVDDVFQKAFVNVDETGTEAAAATGAVVTYTSAIAAHPFVADHPFVYAIRDRAGNLLFMGRLADPTP